MRRSFGYLIIAVKPKDKCNLYYVKHGLMLPCVTCLVALTGRKLLSNGARCQIIPFYKAATIRQVSGMLLKWETKSLNNVIRSTADIFYLLF
jgi:hypothetical protein